MADDPVLSRVRAALGRTGPLTVAPVPPAVDEPITRLVQSDIGLGELFAGRAADNKMIVQSVTADDIGAKMVAAVKSASCRTAAMVVSPLLERLGLAAALRSAGVEVTSWDQMSLDQVYDVDCGVTDVYCAVAETGSLVIRSNPGHGKAVSLIPAVHVAVVQRGDILPDLVDLFDKLAREGVGSNVVLITGPSKTSDIEMTLVTGVHGPQAVYIFMLDSVHI